MILYIDASSGASGDMLLAALLDLGLPRDSVQRELGRLGLGRWKISFRRLRQENGWAGRFSVEGQSRFPRVYRAGALLQWIRRSRLSRSVKAGVIRALELLVQAEAQAHGVARQSVHFHQLAGPDTLAALVGFSAGLVHFRVRAVYVSAVRLGAFHLDPEGRRRFFPGPATRRILSSLRIQEVGDRFEWTTPTGAALLAAFGVSQPAPPFRIARIGRAVGWGRPRGGPSILRLLLGKPI